MEYELSLTKEQVEVLIQALDLYSRIGIGQFEEILDVYDFSKISYESRDDVKQHMMSSKVLAGHSMNGNYGIHNEEINDKFRIAYDIQQVVRHRLAWDRNPKGEITVNFDKPRQISKMELPKIVNKVKEVLER